MLLNWLDDCPTGTMYDSNTKLCENCTKNTYQSSTGIIHEKYVPNISNLTTCTHEACYFKKYNFGSSSDFV
jgi:hypothetical protein